LNLSCVLGWILESILLMDPSKNLFQQTASDAVRLIPRRESSSTWRPAPTGFRPLGFAISVLLLFDFNGPPHIGYRSNDAYDDLSPFRLMDECKAKNSNERNADDCGYGNGSQPHFMSIS